MRFAVVTATVAMLCGCGGRKDDQRKPEPRAARPDPQAALASVGAALAEVNAKIPEELRGKLEFTAALGEKDRHVAVLPKGWENGSTTGSVRPPDAAGLGFMTQFETHASCDGNCEPKDWAASAERVDFAPFKGQDYTVLKDEPLGSGRILVAKTVDRTYVAAATWKTGARRYFVCHATLDHEIAAAAPAFEAACRALHVVTWE